MSEFGHIAVLSDGVLIDAWGTGPFVMYAGGKKFMFEDSQMFGPALIKSDGALRDNPYPPERSPFWKAHACWRRQGRRVDGITCVWDEPKPMIIQHRGGQHWDVIDGGEEDGVVIKLNRDGKLIEKPVKK
jgi:hypothetical protein